MSYLTQDTLNIVLFNLGRNLRGEALERVGYFHMAELVSKFVRGMYGYAILKSICI